MPQTEHSPLAHASPLHVFNEDDPTVPLTFDGWDGG